MTCRLCSITPPDLTFASPRQCAFTTGVFTTDNWQCASMNHLRGLAEPVRQYGFDESAAVMWVGDEDSVTFVLIEWYKNRGATRTCLIRSKRGVWRPPTVQEIDVLVR